MNYSKTLKLTLLSLISWLLYFWIENAKIIENFSDKLDRVYSTRGLGILIFMYLGKYFLFLLAVISIIFLFKVFLTKKTIN
ncbi:hypothetical protein C8N26_2612 [Tenacibaculum lutimaris]|uniref:Uncharacterized protein n=1 Tax=Tenacibaculum lutimaris TaxID=285258 RepID=A0A420DY62_9FLAO|nr:hypothetical protein C8N26_2612 [Tenacibaculum lutimaris]